MPEVSSARLADWPPRSGRRDPVRQPVAGRPETRHRPLHARQRARSGRDPGPPRAGRHAHGLVQGRRRRRDAGQIRPRAFPRTSDVQGHRQEPDRASSRRPWRSSAARRTPSPPRTTPAISSACRARISKMLMEFESDRMTGLVLTDEAVAPELKVVLEEHNQRVANNPRRAALRADRRRALSQPSLRPAGDRLAAGDREAQPRRGAGVLPALLHAQQRRAGGRRRRHRPTRSRRSPRRPTARSPKVAEIAPAAAAAGAARRSRARHVTLADPRVAAAEPAARLSRAVVDDRQARRIRSARSAGAHPRPRHHQPALSHAGGRARHRRRRRRLVQRHRARCHAVRRLRLAQARRRRCRSSKTPSTP